MTTAQSHTPVIHSLLAERRSPYVFDATRTLSATDLQALLEAARWSASSFNEQPWRFVVGHKGLDPQTWQQLHEVLLEGNQSWAAQAPVLMLGVIKTHFSHNGKPNGTAAHDLGAAAASLTLEATARGLSVHQMAGIVPQRARELFAIEDGFTPLTALAIGYAGDPAAADPALAQRDGKPRTRKPISELVLAGALQ